MVVVLEIMDAQLADLTEQGMQKSPRLTVHKTSDKVGHAYITYI